MANFFCSVGYSAENVHSGMIAYLCDLWNEGEREPLGSFLDRLGVPLRNRDLLRAARERYRIDLVILDGEDGSAVVAIEMKVDSHEGLVDGVPQTIAYPKLLPDDTPFLFVTLGVGEFYHPPHGERARWVRLRHFLDALKAIERDDPFIGCWREAVANEVDLQDRCFSDNRSRIEEYRGRIEEHRGRIEEYRGRTWNLYLLGHLKEKLVESLSGRDIGIDPFVYAHGRGPDTILYFGRSKLPAYLEVNQDGRLNLKVYLGDLNTVQAKQERFRKVRDDYQQLLGDYRPEPKGEKLRPTVKGKAVMSFDIGLERQDGNLSFGAEIPETVGKLAEILERFYGESPIDDVDIDPAIHPPHF